MNKILKSLKEMVKEITLLSHANALLAWDQETYMPTGAIEERAEQMALLGGIAHEKMTSDRMVDLLNDAAAVNDLSEFDKDYIRVLKRDVDNNVKLSTELVQQLARTTSKAQAAWVQAREKSDFSLFKDNLSEVLILVKEKAEALGYEDSPYDALLDEFEPGLTTADVSKVFGVVGKDLSDFINELKEKPQIDNSILFRKWDVKKQEKIGLQILRDMGYNFETGRQDLSAHPFTTTLGFHDVRITTRYDENFLSMGLYGSIHEGGHALYEQGLSDELKYSHLATGTSLGIHESQSRMWENLIGRSKPFVERYFSLIKDNFSHTTKDIDSEMLYRALNKVEPSFVRVEADEVTYSLHIILRYTIEREMIEEGLSVDDLEGRWNELSQELLGIKAKKASDGVLQDVHWSMGAIGYFPTYALGNLYGSQFYDTMNRDLNGVDQLVTDGDFDSILCWLRENIHQYGRRKDALDLCKDITGESINPQFFLNYIKTKFRDVYDI